MTDREKVIIGLETCSHANEVGCDQCPYYGTQGEHGCQSTMQIDALAILTDTTSWIKEPNRRNHWHCEKCRCVVGLTAWMYTYCPVCGRRLTGEIEFDG